jgi:ABC-2 type transport system permease protein
VTSLFLHELRAQQRLFWRSREAAFFTFLLPIVFLVLLGSVYGDANIDGIRAATYLLSGMIGYGVTATAFVGLAISIVIRRESGVLKRVRGTPMPPAVYLAAVIASVLVVISIEVTAQVLIGRFLLDADWPASALALVGSVALGAASFAALGLAISGLVKSAEGASAVINAVYLPMTFISGVFFSSKALPGFLEAISDVLPLTFLLRLVQSTFLEGESLGAHPGSVVALSVWAIAGIAVALRIFRWEPREAL